MAEKKTNASIKRFKQFLRSHPEIVRYVHKHHVPWSNVYDDWVIFGENDEVWEKYGVQMPDNDGGSRKNNGPLPSINKLLGMVDAIDTKQWQERLETISGALTGIQTFIGNFSKNNPKTEREQEKDRPAPLPDQEPHLQERNPFFFRRD